jgi:hypothetical protein
LVSQVSASAVTTWDESFDVTDTEPQVPSTDGDVSFHLCARDFMMPSSLGVTTMDAVDCPEQLSLTKNVYPAVAPAATRTITVPVMSQGASLTPRREPPRRCDRTVDLPPYVDMGVASERVNGA